MYLVWHHAMCSRIGSLAFLCFLSFGSYVQATPSVNIPSIDLVVKALEICETVDVVSSVTDSRIPKYFDAHSFYSNSAGLYMMIATNNEVGASFVAFRTTEQTKDWIVNFNIVETPLGPIGHTLPAAGEVHSGFNNALEDPNVLQSIVKFVHEEMDPQNQLVIAGHSKGGERK